MAFVLRNLSCRVSAQRLLLQQTLHSVGPSQLLYKHTSTLATPCTPSVSVRTPNPASSQAAQAVQTPKTHTEQPSLPFVRRLLCRDSLQSSPDTSILDWLLPQMEHIQLGSHESHANKHLTVPEIATLDKLVQTHHLSNHRSDPFYMVDLGAVVRQHREWSRLLPSIKPFYAVKCNPDPLMIRLLHFLGCGFDCASQQELDTLQQNGIDITTNNNQVVFSHPCKHPKHLAYAASLGGVNLCTFDNPYELEKIRDYHAECGALLRIQVDDTQSICQFNSKFGYSIDKAEDARAILDACRKHGTRLAGVNFHVGSGCLDASVYREAIEKSRFLFDMASREFGFEDGVAGAMNVLDIGGGFPGVNDEKSICFSDIANVINCALNEYGFADERYRLIAEPGRYYAAKSHTLVCDVIAKKRQMFVEDEREEQGFMYYLNDGMYASFNCMYFDHAVPDVYAYKSMGVEERDGERKYLSTLFGPTCDSMDKMMDRCVLPELDVLDQVVVPNFGAYTGAAATGFNGFPKSISRYVMTL